MNSFYLIGNAFSSSRARSIIDLLSGQAEFSYFYLDRKHFLSRHNGKFFLPFRLAVYLIGNLIGLLSSKVVFVLPGGVPTVLEIFIIAIFKKTVVFDFYISVYESLVDDRRTLRKGSLKARLLRAKERWLLVNSKKIFVNSYSEFEYFCEALEYVPMQSRCEVIRLATELKPIRPSSLAMNLTEPLNVFWWGTFIPLHGFDKIVQTAVEAKRRGANIKFFCFGPPKFDASQYYGLIKAHDVEDNLVLECERSLSAGELDELILETAHVALGSFGDTGKARVVCCNKVVESIAFGVPVVTGNSHAIKELFPLSKFVHTVSSEPESILEGIQEAAAAFYGIEPDLRVDLLSQTAKEVSVSKFKNHLLNSLREIYDG